MLTKYQFHQESLFYVNILSQQLGQEQEDGTIMICSDDNADEDEDEYEYEEDLEQKTSDILARKGALIKQSN